MTATGAPPNDGDAEDEATVVVDRGDDDRTVLVEREDHTVVVTRAAAPPSKTMSAATVAESTDSELVEATDSASASKSSSTSASASKFSESTSGMSNSSGPMLKVPARTRARARPELRPAPVPSGFGRVAQEAIGVGAIMSYGAGAPAPVMAIGHTVESGPVPTRASTPSMPSVELSSRRTAIVSLAVVAGACAISLGGLIALIAGLIDAR